MTEKKSKPVSELRIADLKKNPVWHIMNDDRNAELDVQAVKRLPVDNLQGKLVGTEVSLANGGRVWALIGNLDATNAERNGNKKMHNTPGVLQYLQHLRCSRRSSMRSTRSVVISMRLPKEIGNRLKRMANRHGWTPSDASARLVEEGLRRSEFAFIDFRDSDAGRQAYIQGSSLAVWEVMLLVQSYKADVSALARHLKWSEAKVQAAIHYAKAFPEEIENALSENAATDFEALKRMLPQASEFVSKRAPKG